MKAGKQFLIDNRALGSGIKPFVIAEISANHGGSLTKLKNLIVAAKQSGVDAVKIQSYTAETMTIDCELEDFWISSKKAIRSTERRHPP